MTDSWDEARLIADGFERVHVELEWYDGPRFGLADVESEPHYFQACSYDRTDEPGEYVVWPASDAVAALEREQWALFVEWNARYEAGLTGPETHPGSGGMDARYDELDEALASWRREPSGARRLVGEMRFDDNDRYRVEGLDYWFRWRPSN
ncbi:hypothetical protein [Streptomyces abyssomicinicus]|uniref:hypothetical protein n=1 Tax=Streptomyces abyssomicinicus TaxID=574929 RepID=UPI0012507F67|nr:hypothetical protein [Streptomyces abyssomicinicus]